MDAKKFIWVVINLVVFGIIFYILWWAVGYMAIPDPFNKVIRAVLVLGAVIVVINALLSLVGKEFITWNGRNQPPQG